jgi:peroxiredoxin
MSDKWKFVLIFLVLIGSIGLFSLYFIFFESERPSPRVEFGAKVGDEAKDFVLPTLRGNSIKLSDYRGKAVFLNIWATWCPPCREEMPSMEALYKRLKGREFEMLAVSIDRNGKEVVGPFVAKYALTFPVLLDPDRKTYRLYGLTGIPETFIIGKNGFILLKIIGAQNWMEKKWLDYFNRIIGGK